MYCIRQFIFLATSFFVVGCGQLRDEFGTSGGFVSPLADRVILASSQREQADRYVLAMLMLAPLALDTAADAAESRATSDRVNELYRSLLDLYKAMNECTPGPQNTGQNGEACRGQSGEVSVEANGYSFETLSYEVQSDLYFIGRHVVTNLDLDEEVSELIDLNPTALLQVARAARDAFPVARRSAATYRDGTIILADAVAYSCSLTNGEEQDQPSRSTEEETDCDRLDKNLKAIFDGNTRESFVSGDERELRQLLVSARKVARDHHWALEASQYAAIINHIDRACERAFFVQLSDVDEDTELQHCGIEVQVTETTTFSDGESKARQEFWDEVSSK